MYDYGYNDYDYGMSQVGNMLSTLLIVAGIMAIVSIVLVVLQLIGQWKCFKKAGYKGWEILIGGHSQFVNCTFAGVNPILILILMFGSVVTVIPVIGWLAYIGFLIYYQFTLGINTAKAFGKGTGFGVALAIPISAPIAWFILGKDEIDYVGPQNNNSVVQPQVQMNNQPTYEQPIVTPVMPTPEVTPVQPVVNTVQEPEQPITTNVSQTFCTNCGNPLLPGAKFCTHCGTHL